MKIMINGLPGNMAGKIKKYAEKQNVQIVPYSITGDIITESKFEDISLVKASKRDEAIKTIKEEYAPFITIDYTHPSAINSNVAFYIKNNLPFVMGTTGGDEKKLCSMVTGSNISAVISPNMAKQIVAFQCMMEFLSNNFPMLFSNYKLKIEESHQEGKADTSGTAKAMIKYFNKLGLSYKEEDIQKERDKENQVSKWKIPKEHLSGHAWHTYTITSNDEDVKFEFKHNVNGRGIYCAGTFDAVLFLYKKIEQGEKGKVYTMIDVLNEKKA